MIEIWRSVVGYERYYEVSNFGRVKSLNYRHTGKEQILKPRRDKNGYLTVNLWKNGKAKNLKVHRLVGMAFPDMVGWAEDAKGKPFEELTINHKKEGLKEKANNHVSNLEWITLEGNLKYGTRTERSAKARTNGKLSKHVAQKTKDGELIKIWPSAAEVQRQTGWCQQSISACCRGHKNYKSAYGYVWQYVRLES